MCSRADGHAGSQLERMVLPATPLSALLAMALLSLNLLFKAALVHQPLTASLHLSSNSTSASSGEQGHLLHTDWWIELAAIALMAALGMAAVSLAWGLMRLRRTRSIALNARSHGVVSIRRSQVAPE